MNEVDIVLDLAPPSNIGRLLLESGRLTAIQAESVHALQQEEGIRFGEAAIKLGYIGATDIQYVLSRQFAYPYLERDDTSISSDVIAAYDPYTPAVEQLRSLRSQLTLRWIAEGNKAFTIVSHEHGAGSSYIAANLAVVFSQLGARTLLIDASLRIPRQHEHFRIENRIGLSDILAGRADMQVAHRIDKLLDLSVLTAGTPAPNPQELLSRRSFVELLSQVSRAFDVVIIDTPPMVDSADAQVIASRTRAALLVANRHQTSLAGMQSVIGMLRTSGTEVLGCVLNEAPR